MYSWDGECREVRSSNIASSWRNIYLCEIAGSRAYPGTLHQWQKITRIDARWCPTWHTLAGTASQPTWSRTKTPVLIQLWNKESFIVGVDWYSSIFCSQDAQFWRNINYVSDVGFKGGGLQSLYLNWTIFLNYLNLFEMSET